MKDFILNELSVSNEIRKKIDFLSTIPLSFKDFNDFKFLIENLNNFKINDKLSESRVKMHLNRFVGNLVAELDRLVNNAEENCKSIAREYYVKDDGGDSIFFGILARLSQVKNQEATQNETQDLINDITSLLERGVDKDKQEILQKALEIMQSYEQEHFSQDRQTRSSRKL